jgi:tetratricopeptide (TPR) repeat protein
MRSPWRASPPPSESGDDAGVGLKDFFKRTFGAAAAATAPQVITLREPDIARAFPLQTPRTSEGRRRAHVKPCSCGAQLVEVLVTTGAALGDHELWRSYPLAVDGWVCATCSKITLPRFLEPEEVNALSERGISAAKRGDLDEAEMCFRRITNAWPGYPAGHADLSTVLGQKLIAAEKSGAPTTMILRELRLHLHEAVVDAEPAQRPRLLHLLGRAYLRNDDVTGAIAAVDEVLSRVGDGAERTEVESVRAWIVGRGDLYDRGCERIDPHMRVHDRPWAPPDAAARIEIARGIDDLLRHVDAKPDSWPALWIAGKGKQALGEHAAAAALFGRAAVINPTQVDVRREHALALQEAGDFAGAVAAAHAACATDPSDAGLVCNLALAQLFAGDVAAAHASAARAVAMDGDDRINRKVLELITEVRDGKRKRPTSPSELEKG